jgi:hypothetical protein
LDTKKESWFYIDLAMDGSLRIFKHCKKDSARLPPNRLVSGQFQAATEFEYKQQSKHVTKNQTGRRNLVMT